ncbi:hypothetical protein [Kallotenue papyrolyticum]|uniref:hypothetical protein n=1 Tax=Kallotenue papyrolyticum TaxID=1325125 RepID=UPI000492B7C9|nr:hypothetical protein [Kallotenue papyrolyticum]
MRNKRSALGALVLAGLAYVWTNRDRLGQQLQALRSRRNGGSAPRYALPDLHQSEVRDFSTPGETIDERRLRGTSL